MKETIPTTLLPLLLIAACAQGSTPTCFADADCVSGICLPSGHCAQAANNADMTADSIADAGQDVAREDLPPSLDGVEDTGRIPDSTAIDGGAIDADLTTDRGPSPDVAPDRPADEPSDGLCRPNHNGRIEANELPVVFGLQTKFRTAQDVAVSTAGSAQGDGMTLWDFSAPFAGDHDLVLSPAQLTDQWFAEDFPGATYFVRLRDGEEEVGVYEATDEAVLLRGVASPESGISRTSLSHDPPVTVFSLPFEVGDTWETDASVSGIALGLPSLFREHYQSTVDARGELVTPFGTFPVLRVNVEMRRTGGLLVTTHRTHLYVSECFGSVAVVHSEQGEENALFTEAAEILRLAP